MSVIGSNVLAGASGQSAGGGAGGLIPRSLRFNSGDSSFLNRTPSSAGNRKTWTWSAWLKRSKLGTWQMLLSAGSTTDDRTFIGFVGSDTATYVDQLIIFHSAGGSITGQVYLNPKLRDCSAWYHIVISADLTNSTANNRVKGYINGVQVDATIADAFENADTQINNTVIHQTKHAASSSEYLDGYLADVHFIDGQALAPTDFGETNTDNLWVPKAFAGTYNSAGADYVSQSVLTGTIYSGAGGVDKIFDGTTATCGPNAASYVTFTPSTPIPITSSFRVRANVSNASGDSVFAINGSDVSTVSTGFPAAGGIVGAASTWTTITGYTQLTSLKFGWGSNWMAVSGIEIDGVELVNIPAGVNGFHLDFADNSSNAALGVDSSSTGLNRIETGSVSNGVPVLGSMTFTGHSGANAVNLRDNNTSTASADGNGLTSSTNMGYDLLIPYKVRKIQTIGDPGGSGVTYSSVFNIQYSDDNSTWTTVTGSNTTHSITAGNGQNDETTIDDNGAHRYWRLYYSSGGSGGNIWIASLNMFADDIGANNWFVNNLSVGTPSARPYASQLVSSTGFNASYPAIKAFDDSTSTYAQASTSGGTLTFTPSAGIAYSSSIKIFMPSAGATASINGGSSVSVANSSEATIATGSGTLTSLVLAASNLPGLAYIKIDDQILVNSGLDTGNDSLVDTPTNGATASDTGAGGEITGCYATWNPLDMASSNVLTNGNLDIALTGAGIGKATIHVSSGKWYWEILKTDTINNVCGIATSGAVPSATYLGGVAGTAGFTDDGPLSFQSPFGRAAASDVGAISNGDILGLALDCDNGTLKLYINNVLQTADHFTFTPGLSVTPAIGTNVSRAAYPTNFGARSFAFSAPTGFKCLNTANLSSTIADGSKYFDTKLYTGNGGTQTISGMNMSPSFIWIKIRSGSGQHVLTDILRGKDKQLFTSNGNAEQTTSSCIQTFESDGFTVNQISGTGDTNGSGSTYVSWNWDAGDSNTTIAAGGLNSSVYDQSQTWSTVASITSGSAYSGRGLDKLFNGIVNNSDPPNNAFLEQGGTGLVVTFSSAIAATSSIKMWIASYSGYNPGELYVNGSNFDVSNVVANNVAPVLVDLGVTSLTSFGVRGNQNIRFIGLVVDGKLLVDSGVTPPTNVPSIASTVRASAASGFSIVSYTGTGANATFGHGLNAAPEMVIIKQRNGTGFWVVGHKGAGFTSDNYLRLNDTNANASGGGAVWQSTAPTSSVVYLGDSGISNGNNNTHIAYCFAPVEGYSSMGKYPGNGSADGPFVYTGMKPAFIMIKGTGTSNAFSWIVVDAARSEYNPTDHALFPNSSNDENNFPNYGARTFPIDFLSNGFKIRIDSTSMNSSGYEYIYLAFASNPFASNGGLAR